MSDTAEDAKLKKLLKDAVVEVLEERRDLFHDAVAEAIEDLAMARAIQEGARSENASRAEILKILGSGR